MASVRVSDRLVACINLDKIEVFTRGGTERHEYRCAPPPTQPANTDKPQGIEDGSARLLAFGFSPSGRLFAACDDYKQLSVWDTSQGPSWTLLSTRSVGRRCTGLVFTQTEEEVVVADKSGDAFSFPARDGDTGGRLLLGHVSMLLDVCLCADDQFVVTCDRDEKIRVSCYPNSYSIHSYCLGHTDFVSRLAYVPDQDLLLSGSGDGGVCLWEYRTGALVAQEDCKRHLTAGPTDITPTPVDPPTPTDSPTHMDSLTLGDPLTPADHPSPRAHPRDRRTRTGCDVSCLLYCPRHQVALVGFETRSVLLVLAVGDRGLRVVGRVDCGGPLWGAALDPDGVLWVVRGTSRHPLQTYTLTDDKTVIPLTPEQDSSSLLTTVDAINDTVQFYDDCKDVKSIFPVLHKVRIDNITGYKERKEERMGHGRKPRKRQRNKGAPPAECREKQTTATEATPGEKDSSQSSDSEAVPKCLKVD